MTDELITECAPKESIAFPNHRYLIEALPATQWLTATTLVEPDKTKTQTGEQELVTIGENSYLKANDTQKAYLLHDTYFNDKDIIGMCFDTEGNLYVATQMGIQIADHNGRVRIIIPYPEGLVPVAFSFEEDKLKIKTPKGTYMMKVNANAVNPKSNPIEVKSQGQA